MVKQISILLPQASRDGNELPRQMNPNDTTLPEHSRYGTRAPPRQRERYHKPVLTLATELFCSFSTDIFQMVLKFTPLCTSRRKLPPNTC